MKSFVKKKHVLLSLILAFSLSWFFASVFIDFIAAPSIFRNVSSLREAGTLGGIIFTSFNVIEIILGTLLIMSSFLYCKKSLSTYVLKGLSLITLVLAITYASWLSPGIKNANIEKSKLVHTDKMFEVYSTQLRDYHDLYKKLDSLKLLSLLTLCGISLTHLSKLNSKEEGEA